MIATRLLMAGGQGGFDVADPEQYTLTSSPEGGWTQPADPKAYYYNGKTYFTWINGSTGAIKIAEYVHATQTVLASVGGQLTGNQYASGCAIHHSNPDIVYVSVKATRWEMWRYVSSDDGATWVGTQLTTGSSVDNVWPEIVHQGARGLEGVWLAGSYTSDTDYAFGIAGWG